jgi:hypothetical protein
MITKECSKCLQVKIIDNFYRNKKIKCGYESKCKECVCKNNNNYYYNNIESCKIAMKRWSSMNKEYLSDYKKKYKKDNKDIINEWHRRRWDEDSLYRLTFSIRNSIRESIVNNGYSKKLKTYDILGCSFEEFLLHIESKFEDWMTWSNKGLYNGDFNYGWDIDHIIPISSAKTEDDIIKLNHYTNLQPLCSKINRDIKKNKIDYEDL